MQRMRSPTPIEGPNAQSNAATTDELDRRPGPASDDSDEAETQAISRAPSDTTEVTATARVVGLRPQRPRRNYTWLDQSSPPPPANNRDERAQYSDEGQRAAPDPLAHLPPGERPGIVRVREVRRDYEYHYEYIYEEVVPSQAAQLPPAAPQPPQLAPAPPLGQPATPLAAHALVVEPRYSERPVAAPVVAAAPVAAATAAPAFAASEVALRPSLASRAGSAALVAMGVVLVGLATAFFFSARSASHAASAAAKPVTVEAPTAAAPPPTPQPAALATVPAPVASAATPDTVASAAVSASSAKSNKRKKPSTGTPQH
jgi:hypothetical protein